MLDPYFFDRLKSRRLVSAGFFGAPEGIRTPDLLVRSQTLYPTELAAHTTPLLECIIYVIIVEHGCQPFFSSRIIFFAFSSNSLSAA